MAPTPSQTTPSGSQETLKKNAAKLLRYQQLNKKELPTPPTPNQRKTSRVINSKATRKNKIAEAHANRRLLDLGFTKVASIPSNNDVVNTQKECTLTSSSVVCEQAENIRKEISDNITNISQLRQAFQDEIKSVMQMSEDNSKTQEALNHLCRIVQSNNEEMWNLQESSQQNLLKLLALNKDQEIMNMRRDLAIANNSDKIQSIETKLACNKDLHKVWITFTCEKELEALKSAGNLIQEAKKILHRMEIDINEYGFLPIRSVNFQHIRIERSDVLTLCISFKSDKLASIVRRQIMKYNAKLDEEGRLTEMRYNEKIFWCKDVWKILKICWELKRVKLIDFVNVHVDGIRIQYTNNEKLTSYMNITNFADIDRLRKIVNDIYAETTCTMLYDNDYFKLNYNSRDERRSLTNSNNNEIFEDAASMEY